MKKPVRKTREGIKKELVNAMKGILGSGVTRKALRDPSHLTYEEIIVNLHLYERLGTAFVAVGALNGYSDQPRGFELIEGQD